MRNLIKNKLRQETGASITFALLLFLICAVVSSVVLTAATAASGRMSKTAEYDQRYYSVTSAAELMKEQLDGKTVSIVKVTESTQTTPYTDGIPGEPGFINETSPKIYLAADKTAAGITDADLTERSQIDGEGTNAIYAASLRAASILNDAAWYYSQEKDEATAKELNLSSSLASGENDPLAAVMEESVDAAGNIVLTISNAGAEGKQYTLRLTFMADKHTDTGSRSVDGPREDIVTAADGTVTYNVTTTVTTTEVTSLTWQLTGIETVAK